MATWQHDKHASHASGDGGNPTRTLLLSNLFYEVSQQELALLFGQVGEIVSGPTIRYDKADRSLGQASLTYKELPHAIKAFQSFNGAIAKGQPIAIKYDRTPQPPALLARLDGTATSTKSRNPFDTKLFSETPYSRSPRTSLGTTDRKPRTSLPRNSNDGSDSRDRRGPRQSNERRPAPNSNKREKKPASKTADELDRELDNFMKTPIVKPAPAAVKVTVDASDVVMS